MNIRESVEKDREKALFIGNRLLEWYDLHQRDLPWRENKDPYRIWVSEVMLQQTRVETVKPYYNRWMERFPNAASLAEASEEEVMAYWQGLGYYSRARNLQAGVREVMESYGGKIPGDRESMEQLPGVGDYLAGAVLSIAYDKPEPAVDGNVLRVFSRLYCYEEDVTKGKGKKAVRQLVQAVLPAGRPGDFNQAVMDLGSLLCIPGKPRCGECPLAEICCAHQTRRTGEVPLRKKRSVPLPVTVVTAVVEIDGKVLLRQRPQKGLLAGLWEFPSIELTDNGEGDVLSDIGQIEELMTHEMKRTAGISVECWKNSGTLVHTFSHRRWNMQILSGKGKILRKDEGERLIWVEWETGPGVNLAGPHNKVWQAFQKSV